MTEDASKTPMIGYRQELTDGGIVGLIVMIASPMVTGAIWGLMPVRFGMPSFIFVAILGSVAMLIGAVLFSVGRQYIPFHVQPPDGEE